MALGQDGGSVHDFDESEGVQKIGRDRALFADWVLGMEAQLTRAAKYMVANSQREIEGNYCT